MPGRQQRYGVALFDDPSKYMTGWATIGGETAAEPFYFTNTGDLTNDVIWLTNLDGDTFYRSGLSKTPRFRYEYYLRTKVSSIILELGLKDNTLMDQSVFLANIFHRVMRLAEYHVGLSGAPINSLATGLRQIYDDYEYRLDSKLVAEASGKASQSFVQCMKPHEIINEEYSIQSLVFHRPSYAKLIGQYKIPAGNWTHAPSRVLAQSNEAILQWIVDADVPCLVKVKIMRIDSKINHLVNYGSGAGLHINKTRSGKDWAGLNQREWMTTPELKIIKRYADLIVEDILCGEGYVDNPVKFPVWAKLSYAAGILCENLWVCATKDISGRNAKTPISAWIHSIDRMHCLLAAIEIDNSKLVAIHSYGYGRVTVCIPKDNVRALPDLAFRFKMISPMLSKEEKIIRRIPKDASQELIMQSLMERSAIDLVEQQDLYALNQAISGSDGASSKQSQTSLKISL